MSSTDTADDPIEGFKLSDWKVIENKQPYLVQFAVDHALPISTSECERSFSSAKFTLNPLRTCMKSDLFEAIETLRAWYLQDHQDKDRGSEGYQIEGGSKR
jgi:hAT family C-terminal dimerisation region